MIAKIDNYDLVLTYSWGNNNHGISGHTFEVIDYYWILKDHFNCCILFAEEFTRKDIDMLLRSKYDFNDDEIEQILDNCVFKYKPKIVLTKNIIFTDGGMHNEKQKEILIKADNKFSFTCSPWDMDGYTILEDERVYGRGNINYKKKILFDRLKPICVHEDNTLLYITKNCRRINRESLVELSHRDERFLCLVNNMDDIYEHEKFSYEVVPVFNLQERFHKYLYTPITRKWDCSPRFIAECKWYGKEVEYFNIDYWDEDLGLKYRVWDIENDFESLHLNGDDEIVEILKSYI